MLARSGCISLRGDWDPEGYADLTPKSRWMPQTPGNPTMGEEDLAAKDMEIAPCSSQTSIPRGLAGWLEESAPFLVILLGFISPASETHTPPPFLGAVGCPPPVVSTKNPFLLASLKGSLADALLGGQTMARASPPSS